MGAPNRHAADRLSDVRSEIRRLQVEEEKLRAHLLAHADDRVGDEHIAEIGAQRRRWVDMRGLSEAVGDAVLRRYTITRRVDVVRLRERAHEG